MDILVLGKGLVSWVCGKCWRGGLFGLFVRAPVEESVVDPSDRWKAQRTPFKVAFAAALAFALGFLDFPPESNWVSTNSNYSAEDLPTKALVCIVRVRVAGCNIHIGREES